MKGVIAVLSVLTLLLPAFAEAGFFFELESKVVEGEVTPNLNIYPTHNINDRIQVFAYSLISEAWSEGYGGVAYSPKPWIQAGLAVGMETNDDPWRVATSMWMGRGPFSVLGIYENGGGGYWYLVKATARLSNILTVGVLAKRFAGAGPLIQISVPKTPVIVWGLPAYDFEFDTQKTLFGLGVSF